MVGVGNTAEVFEFCDGKVCKLFKQSYPKDSVEREFRNAKEVQRLGLPVPKVFKIVKIDGRTGIVYEKIDGKSMLECIFENSDKAGFYLKEFVHLQKKWLKEVSGQLLKNEYSVVCVLLRKRLRRQYEYFRHY